MTNADNLVLLSSICDEIVSTYEAKNSDYGDSFSHTIRKHGILSSFIRIEDKFRRFENLVLNGKGKVKDETIEDTLLDLASYAIMTEMELRRKEE